jgi:hypothetical protein
MRQPSVLGRLFSARILAWLATATGAATPVPGARNLVFNAQVMNLARRHPVPLLNETGRLILPKSP